MVESSEEHPNDSGSHYSLLEAIARKCEPFGIECDLEDDLYEGSTIWPMYIEHDFGGTEIVDGPHAQFALSVPFERYREFRQVGHWAIWSPTLGAVECEVEPYGSGRSWFTGEDRQNEMKRTARSVLKNLGVEVNEDENLDPDMRLSMKAGNGISVSVGPCSEEWVVWMNLVRNPREGEPGDEVVVQRTLTLRVEGVEVPDEPRAGAVLDRLGDAALFEIDRASEVALRLVRVERRSVGSRRRNETASALPTRLAAEYDRKPMSLYWYGRSAWEASMPLLAFLAFYQVLEFYYLAYSPSKRVEALRKKLREIAGDVSESDVDGVLGAIGTSKRRLFPEEKKQLMSTIGRCVEPEELSGFLMSDEDRVRFYGSERSRALSMHRIPVEAMPGKRGDYRNKVAERIYEIRNRIVHTKSQHDEMEPLLPGDQELDFLVHDIALVRFLAQQVLAVSARPLRTDA